MGVGQAETLRHARGGLLDAVGFAAVFQNELRRQANQLDAAVNALLFHVGASSYDVMCAL